MASKSEKVTDIIVEMREAHGVDCRDWADRIEAAHNEQVTLLETALKKSFAECSQLRKRLKVAEDALDKIFKLVFVDCEVAMVAKNALAAIREKGGVNA